MKGLSKTYYKGLLVFHRYSIAILMVIALVGSVKGQDSFESRIKAAKKISSDRLEQIEALKEILPTLNETSYHDTLALLHYALAFRYYKLDTRYTQHNLYHARQALHNLEKSGTEHYLKSRCLKYIGMFHLRVDQLDSVKYYTKLLEESIILDSPKSVSCYTIIKYYTSTKYINSAKFEAANQIIDDIMHSKYWDRQIEKDKSHFLSQKIRLMLLHDFEYDKTIDEIQSEIQEVFPEDDEEYRGVISAILLNWMAKFRNEKKYDEGILKAEDIYENNKHISSEFLKYSSNVKYNSLLSQLYLRKNEFDKAFEYAEIAKNHLKSSRKNKYIDKIPYLAFTEVYIKKGEYQNALNELEKPTREFFGENDFVKDKLHVNYKNTLIHILHYKADIYYRWHQEDPKREYLEKIMHYTHQMDTLWKVNQQEIYFRDGQYRNTANALENYQRGIYAAYRLQDIDNMWYFFERGKGSILLNELQNDDDTKQQIDKIKKAKIDIQIQKEFSVTTDKEREELAQKIVRYNQEILDWIEDQDNRANITNRIVSLDRIKHSLKKQQGIASFAEGIEHVFLMLIFNNQVNIHKIQNIDSVRQQIETFNQAIQNNRDVDAFKKISHELYNTLAKELKGKNINEWIIVPTPKMSTLPFSSLVDEEGTYLVHDFAFSYATSGSIFDKVQDSNNFITTGTVICPEYQESNASQDTNKINLPPLKFSYTEAKSIENLVPNTKLSRNTNKSKLLQIYRESDFLHFTGHAVLYKKNPDLSYLALSSNDTTKVTSLEISTEKSNAKIIGLSACNTKKGIIRKGEGIFGLARSFLQSGSKSVISTLWEVNDRSTSKIFENFYTRTIQDNADKNIALQQAKIDYIANTEDYLTHPYYWSGIILNGNTKNVVIVKSPVKYIYYGLGILIFVFLIQILLKRFYK